MSTTGARRLLARYSAEQLRFLPSSSNNKKEAFSLAPWLEEIKPRDSFLSPVTPPELPSGGGISSGVDDAQWLHVGAVTAKHQAWSFRGHLNLQADVALVLHRWKIWWSIPRLLRGVRTETVVPPETYLYLTQAMTGAYVLLLPVMDQNMGFTLEGAASYDKDASSGDLNGTVADGSRFLMLHGHDVSLDDGQHHAPASRKALLITTGRDPFRLIATSIKMAKRHLQDGLGQRSAQEVCRTNASPADDAAASPRGTGPRFADYFGWCSWDSFYTDLSADGVLGGLSSFQGTGVTPRFLILDDGWQGTTVDDRANSFQWGGRLTSFDANFKFASGYDGFPAPPPPSGAPAPVAAAATAAAKENTTATGGRRTLLGAGNRNTTARHSLSGLISRAKELHHIKHMLVWHTLSGYWAGVHVPPSGSPGDGSGGDGASAVDDGFPTALASYMPEVHFPDLTPTLRRMSVANALDAEPFTTEGVGLVAPSLADAFFADYHANLRAMGVDGVKVDAQSIVASLRGRRGGGHSLALAFHTALKASVAANFGRGQGDTSGEEFPVIHCMAHSQATLLAILSLYLDVDDGHEGSDGIDGGGAISRARRQQGRLPVLRGSDDFWPTDAASHGPHLYANSMNSLLISQIAVHDWDMFTTGMGKPSAMHACARALSGGPVYVSDRPEEHDPLIIQRLAFADGSVPRCLRNARPTAALLFADPQREVGVPLLLQNVNPCGGMVVGGFNIAGAILENDRDMFRFLRPGEMRWRDVALQGKADEAERNREAASRPTSVHEMAEFADALAIRWWVSPADIEETAAGVRRHADYVAHRLSDGAVFVLSEDDGEVPVHLASVFDHEVVSFALKHRAGLGGTRWVAAIGAVNMFNPGGAVLYFTVTTYGGEGGGGGGGGGGGEVGLEVRARFLGAGAYVLVTNAVASTPTELVAKPLNAAAAYRVEASASVRPLPGRSDEGGEETAVAIDITTAIHTDGKNQETAQKVQRKQHVSGDGRDEDDRGVEVSFRLPLF